MAIENMVNSLKQLNAFNAFAADKDANAVIRFNAADKTFSVAANDRIKRLANFWTAPGRDVVANNRTREAFKTSLLTLFNAKNLDSLPDSVKSVLNKGDFDNSGKPLSARRVKAIMASVVETKAYNDTVEHAALSDFTNSKFALNENDTKETIKEKAIDFCANVQYSKTRGGGDLLNLISIIGGKLNMAEVKSSAGRFFSAIERSLKTGSSLCFGTNEVIGDGNYSNLPNVKKIEVAFSGNIIKDLNDFYDAWKTYAESQLKDANPGVDEATLKKTFAAVKNEMSKLVDKLKIRMAALESHDKVGGTTVSKKIENFEALIALIKKQSSKTKDEQLESLAVKIAPMTDVKVDSGKLEAAKKFLKDFLIKSLAYEKEKNYINSVTGVSGRMLREMNQKSVTINAKLISSDKPAASEESIVIAGVSDDQLTDAVWKSENTGTSGTGSQKSVNVHKEFCKAIPDRRMREFVSNMISMSDGIKGFFDCQVGLAGTEEDSLKLFGDKKVGSIPMDEAGGVAAIPLVDANTPDSYDITSNGNGDVTVIAKFSIGMQDVSDNTNGGKGHIFSRNDFEVTINLYNDFDKTTNLPKIEILPIDVVTH